MAGSSFKSTEGNYSDALLAYHKVIPSKFSQLDRVKQNSVFKAVHICISRLSLLHVHDDVGY